MKGDCISDNEGCNAPAFITPINHPCAGLPGLKYTDSLGAKGPSTYLNGIRAGELKLLAAGINCGKSTTVPGLHSTEDTFAPCAPNPIVTGYDTSNVDRQYAAEYTPGGGVNLVLTTTSTYVTKRAIASFDTMADAQTAAKALNNHNGI